MNERPTPETDQVEKYDGFKMKDSVTTCGNESSSVYINVIHARHLERERDKARSELSLKQQTLTITEGTLSDLRKQRDEWAAMCGRYKQERDEAREELIHLRSSVYDVIHSLKSGAFDELEKAWKEGLK